jgi:NADPH:quinone reductase
MKAVLCREYGAPEDLVFAEVRDLTPGPGEVVVRVFAAAVNFPDVLLISGGYQIKVPPPFSPGSEFAGEVLATGDGVTLRPGDRVAGSVLVGAFAEQVVVTEGALTPIPDGVDFAHAAAFGVTYRTAYHCLRSVAEVKPDDWVVVLGAAGGVGLAAVDLAVAMKARVIAAASSREKLDLCLRRSATAAVNYDQEKLRDRIREITGTGADVVLDPVGGPYAEPALRALARGGTFITVGYAAGSIPAIPLNLVLLKGITVQGMEIRTFMGDHPDEAARDLRELGEMLATGAVRPHIGARYPLPDSGAALRHVADRKALGKVIIDVA